MKKEHNIEKAALTYGMFVFCDAAEIMLKHIIGGDGDVANGLHREARMYYSLMIDGMKKAYRGYQGFNERVQTLYSEMGATGDQMDRIRRDSNHMIRMFCYARNIIENKEMALNMDEVMNNMRSDKTEVISQETIEKFTLK